VQWNFEKFLVARDGQVVARFRSSVAPESQQLVEAIARALAQP
jgi:glutathione peroxidase